MRVCEDGVQKLALYITVYFFTHLPNALCSAEDLPRTPSVEGAGSHYLPALPGQQDNSGAWPASWCEIWFGFFLQLLYMPYLNHLTLSCKLHVSSEESRFYCCQFELWNCVRFTYSWDVKSCCFFQESNGSDCSWSSPCIDAGSSLKAATNLLLPRHRRGMSGKKSMADLAPGLFWWVLAHSIDQSKWCRIEITRNTTSQIQEMCQQF